MLAVALASVILHEYLHCVGAGHAWDCSLETHRHFQHVFHAQASTPGDHAWIIPTQLTFATLGIALVGMVWTRFELARHRAP